MKLHRLLWIVGGLLLASAAFAGVPREYPANRGPNEVDVTSRYASENAVHKWLSVGARLSAGLFNFWGSNASYVGNGKLGATADFGPVFKITLNDIIEVDPSLAFGYRYHSYNADEYSVKMEEFLLEIPVALHAYVYRGAFVGAGFQLTSVLHAKNKTTSYGWPLDFKSNNPEFGFLADLGYSFDHFSIDARFYAAVTDYSDNDIIGYWQGLVYYPYAASVGVSYFF